MDGRRYRRVRGPRHGQQATRSSGDCSGANGPRPRVEGSGANWLNDCIPFCAAGKFTPFNVNLTAYRPRVLSGFKVFTRLRVVYTGSVPHGYKRTGVFTLGHRGKQFFWNFPI